MASMFQFTACDKDEKGIEKEVYVSAVLSGKENIYIELGETLPLIDFSKAGIKTGLEITSSNADVISVKDGVITAQKCGETVVTIMLDGESLGSYNVMVYDKNGNVFIIDNGVEVWPIDSCVDAWTLYETYVDDEYTEFIEHELLFFQKDFKTNGAGVLWVGDTNTPGLLCSILFDEKASEYTLSCVTKEGLEYSTFQRVNARPLGILSHAYMSFIIESFDMKVNDDEYEITCEGSYEVASLRAYDPEVKSAYLHYKGKIKPEENTNNYR